MENKRSEINCFLKKVKTPHLGEITPQNELGNGSYVNNYFLLLKFSFT